MRHNHIFIYIVGALFVALTVLFLFFPRSTFSQTERRELKKFPPLTTDSLAKGLFTQSVSDWFSDSGPYRDEFMTASMMVKDLISMKKCSP